MANGYYTEGYRSTNTKKNYFPLKIWDKKIHSWKKKEMTQVNPKNNQFKITKILK